MHGMWRRVWVFLTGRFDWQDYIDRVALRKYVKEDQKRKGATPEQRQARLIQAIHDYWGDDLKFATREQRRRFSRELADLIANNITGKGDLEWPIRRKHRRSSKGAAGSTR